MVRVYKASLDLRDSVYTHLRTIRPDQENFHYGTLDGHVDPGLHVEGIGAFSTPFYERDARSLIQYSHELSSARHLCEAASVKIAHIPGSQLRCDHPAWQQHVNHALRDVCKALSVGVYDVKMVLTALIVDGAGLDMSNNASAINSEPGSFATIAIFPASAHDGGDIVLKGADQAGTYATSTVSRWSCTYMAWLGGVTQSVRAITSGYRLALIYDVIFTGQGRVPQLQSTQNDPSGLRNVLRSWCSTAATDSKLPKFMVIPLQSQGDDVTSCRTSLKPKAAAQVSLLSQLAKELDMLCFLTNVKCRASSTPLSSRFKVEADLADLTRIVNLDGSVVPPNMLQDVASGVKMQKLFFVPPDVYIDRAAARAGGRSDVVSKFRDTVCLLRRNSFIR